MFDKKNLAAQKMINSPAIGKIIFGILISIFFSHLHNFLVTKELSQKDYTILVSSHFSNPNILQLYYDTGSGFNEIETIKKTVNIGKNTTKFIIHNPETLKLIRLDYEQKTELDSVQFNKIVILDSNNNVVHAIEEDNILESIKTASPNIKFIGDKIKFLNLNFEDTYLIFKPIFTLKTNRTIRVLLFLFPIVLMFSNDIFRLLKSKINKSETNDLFACLLIITFPLKESFTTFVILLWSLFAVLEIIKTNNFQFKIENIILGIFLVVPIAFGRSMDYSDIHILLSLILIILINGSFLSLDKLFLYKFYILFFLMLATSLLISWFASIFIFDHYEELSLMKYFSNIKLKNNSIRDWLPYSHAAYYSVFIIFSNLFAHKLLKQKIITLSTFLLIFFISLATILILGSRIALALYLLILIGFLFNNNKQRIFFYKIACSSYTILLFVFIGKVDVIRSHLWSVSYSAILEKPLFGHGIGLSEKILNNTSKVNDYTILSYNHSHNQFILFLVEIGIVGTLLIIGIIMLIHIKKSSLFSLDYKVSVFLIYCLFLVESPLETSKSIIMIAFIIVLTNLDENFKNRVLNKSIQ